MHGAFGHFDKLWTTFEWHAFLSAPRAGTTHPGEVHFFPRQVRIKDQLSCYADQFDTTGLNGVFYRTPTPEAVTAWRQQTGRDFVFAWKASKFITHWKRLSDRSENSLELLEDRLSLLRGKAGPILFQLPPQFEVDAERLGSFFKLLSRKRQYSFEFRHPSWYQPRVLRMLSDENISLCLSDHHDAPAPWKRTADFVYVRGHGPSRRYHGHYSRAALCQWAERLKSWKRQGCDVYVYLTTTKRVQPPPTRRLSKNCLAVERRTPSVKM